MVSAVLHLVGTVPCMGAFLTGSQPTQAEDGRISPRDIGGRSFRIVSYREGVVAEGTYHLTGVYTLLNLTFHGFANRTVMNLVYMSSAWSAKLWVVNCVAYPFVFPMGSRQRPPPPFAGRIYVLCSVGRIFLNGLSCVENFHTCHFSKKGWQVQNQSHIVLIFPFFNTYRNRKYMPSALQILVQ
jgi:hypothetical protein